MRHIPYSEYCRPPGMLRPFPGWLGLAAALLLVSGLSQAAADQPPSSWVRTNSPVMPGGIIAAIAAAPSDPRRIYALAPDPYLGKRLLRSDDSARTWQTVYTFPESATVGVLAVDPAVSATVYAGSSNRLWRSPDAGLNWTEVYTSGAGLAVISPTLLYVGVSLPAADSGCSGGRIGLARSLDQGTTWRVTPLGCGSGVNRITTQPGNPALVLVGGTYSFCNIKCYTMSVVYRSQDGGQTWDDLGAAVALALPPAPTPSGEPPAGFARPTGLERPAGANGDGGVRGLAFDPAAPERVYLLTGESFLYSEDSGVTWRSADFYCFLCGFVQSGRSLFLMKNQISIDMPIYRSEDGGQHWWQSLDRYPAHATALAPDLAQPGEIYLSLAGRGVWQSQAAGSRFVERNVGLDSTSDVTALYPSPADPGRLVAAGGPRPMLAATADGGLSWTNLLTDVSVTAFAFNPDKPAGFYLATAVQTLEPTFACELYESDDGVQYRLESWSAHINTFVPTGTPGVVYAGGSECHNDRAVLLRREPAEYGGDWGYQPIAGLTSIEQLVLRSTEPETLLAVGRTASTPYFVLGLLIRLPPDDTWWWQPLGGIPGPIERVFIHPGNANLILVGTSGGVYRTWNGGQSWEHLGGQEQGYLHTYALAADELGQPFVSMYGPATDYVTGVYTWDAAHSQWSLTGLRGEAVRALAGFPAPDRHILAATATGLWRYALPLLHHAWLPIVGRAP